MASEKLSSVGYSWLVDRFDLSVIPHYRKSFISSQYRRETVVENGLEKHVYPNRYAPSNPDDPLSQLEFAFKYDGVNLEIIERLFCHIDIEMITRYIRNQPTGKFSRRLWYLYEKITGRLLDIPETRAGRYVSLLDPKKYYTAEPIRSRRHNIDDNLLGSMKFCPMVRRTEALERCELQGLDQVAKELIKQYEPEVISRAMRYLYTKETKSSFEIEREQPSQDRMQRFVKLLQSAGEIPEIDKEKLIELQNAIVDPRFSDQDYRDFQNYVGEEPALHKMVLHYIAPKPEDVPSMMQGFLSSLKRLQEGSVHPVVTAAVVGFGFVFIHPFEDGNGRLHRFLIHHVLARAGFVPMGGVFPISATMLRDLRGYDSVLESFSSPLMQELKEFTLSEKGELTVHSDTRSLYRYIDYTAIVEYLFSCIDQTIATDFKQELDFIEHYDQARSGIREVVDLPDRKLDLIIKFIVQNHGKLSRQKRDKYFDMLTDDEVAAIEQVVQQRGRGRGGLWSQGM